MSSLPSCFFIFALDKCHYITEGRAEGRLEGRAEGRIESARRTATALLALGKLTLSQIAEATELSQEEVKRLAGTLGA